MIGPGLGFLALSLFIAAVWLWWLRRGRDVSNAFAEHLVHRASAAPRSLRWTYTYWSSEWARDATRQGRTGFWLWLPLIFFLPLLTALFMASAVVEFVR